MMDGAAVTTQDGSPRGFAFMRSKMSADGRNRLQNPKLRELVERDMAEIAYELRKDTKVGSREYRICTEAIRGHLSLPGLALLLELDARSGRGLFCGAISRTTGVSPRSPSPSSPSDND